MGCNSKLLEWLRFKKKKTVRMAQIKKSQSQYETPEEEGSR